jgi:hypothetical protein
LIKRTVLNISLLGILIFGCKKENQLGLPYPPKPSFQIKYTQTNKIIAVTVPYDSVLTDEAETQLLGCINDPVLGISTASFANQFYLENSAVDFGPNCTLDSLVVSYAYSTIPNYYGSANKISGPLKIKVYELLTPIQYDKVYYSNYNISSHYNPLTPVADIITYPEPNRIPSTEETNPSPQLRIRLSDNLGNKLLNASASGTNFLSDNNTFQTFFKGLYIKAENPGLLPGQGVIVYLDLRKPSSKLTLYYKNQYGEHKNFSFSIKGNAAKFNMFIHDYSGHDAYNQINGLSTDTSLLYIQSMGGLRSKIQLPFLNKFKDSGNVAINKCEIEFFIEPNLSTVAFPAFDRLFLTGIDSSGKSFILDDQINGIDYGGTIDPARGSYRFNITRYAQQVVSGQRPNLGLYLMGGNSSTTATRVILKGKQNILVNLDYTIF